MKPLDGELKRAETVLKGHRIDLKRRSELAKEARRLKATNRPLRDKNAIVSLNTIFKKSKRRDLDLKRTKARANKPPPRAPEKYELLFVVRNFRPVESELCRDTLKVCAPNPQELGLIRPNTGRFMSNSAENLRALDTVLPFVFFGPPSLANVRDLLRKRGTVLSGPEPQLIASNVVVEDCFGSFGLCSLAELIETVFRGLAHCEDVLAKLGPIALSELNAYARHFDDRCKYGSVDIRAALAEK